MNIKLPSGVFALNLDAVLGTPGGFGCVFAGSDSAGKPVAIKQLDLDADDSAGREMRISGLHKGQAFEHIMPVLDAGEDPDSGRFYVVMPKADIDLASSVGNSGPLSETECARILLQIASGLAEIPALVHRDLKPANVLLHDGNWKVADFGIAKFVAEATASKTLKGALTREYAAPEQWVLEPVSQGTDIFAVGGIAIFLLTGEPPFPPRSDSAPPSFEARPYTCNDPRLRNLITQMIRVPQGSRPSLSNVVDRLKRILSEPAPKKPLFAALAAAGTEVIAAEQEAEARRRAQHLAILSRQKQCDTAYSELRSIFNRLFETIALHAPAERHPNPHRSCSIEIFMGLAQLHIDGNVEDGPLPPGHFAVSGWDVVAHGQLRLIQRTPNLQWGANLFFGRLDVGPDYRWYEVGYCATQEVNTFGICHPRIAPNFESADAARRGQSQAVTVAYGPLPIDGDDEINFQQRMASLLAPASRGQFKFPTRGELVRWPYPLE